MNETAALSKFACPSCGGEAVWNAAQKKLVCAFCGAVSNLEPPPVAKAVVEHDLKAALEDRAGTVATAPGRIAVICQSCRAVSLFEAGRVADRCQFCGASALVPYENLGKQPRPESVLPFEVDQDRARDALRTWYRWQFLAPNALKRQARMDTCKGMYLPFWTFDASATSEWSGAGTASGTVRNTFDDVPVPASTGVKAELLRGIEPFPTNLVVTYEPRYLAGWPVEGAQVALADAVNVAHTRMTSKMLDLAKREVGRDRDKVRLVSTRFDGERFKLALLPVWLLTYRYAGKYYQVAVNGHTAAVDGDSPKSWIKVALLLIVLGWGWLFTQDPETAIKLPFWIMQGLWSLAKSPFSH